jgi:PAS domain S-box-containing protein
MTHEPSRPEPGAELEDLRVRLADAEEVLRAIRSGSVDAVIVTGDRGEQVYTLSGDSVNRQLIEAMSESAVILSADGVIIYCNLRLAEVLGRPLDRVMGTRLQDYLSAGDQQALDAVLAQARTAPSRREISLEASDGRRVPVYLSASRLRSRGAATVFCLVLTDLTEVRRHEQVAAAEQKMRRLRAELERSNRELQRQNKEIQNFYHTLSHELKTPLTSAREFVSIVIDGLAGPLNETQSEYLGIAKESCDQLRLYVNDLLDVTRLETGKMSLEFRTAPVAALVERAVKALAPAAAKREICLSCDCQPDLPAVPFDQHRIQQVMTNIITNAIQFTPAGGQIRVSLSEAPASPECLQVAVRDSGRGIPTDQLGAIFTRLYQVNGDAWSTEPRSGLGLGLYICKELVQMHGGRIWVDSQPGRGSTFTFTIPKRQASASVNVLAADDEGTIADSLHHTLDGSDYESEDSRR